VAPWIQKPILGTAHMSSAACPGHLVRETANNLCMHDSPSSRALCAELVEMHGTGLGASGVI
jgi:hypothetical protein